MKRNEIIVHEHKKGVRAVKYNAKPQGHIEPPKPRNPVAKNAGAAIGGGAAGAHKDAKKASQAVRGQKHKNAEMAETTKKPNATTRHLRDYTVSDKDKAKPVKKPEKKKSEQGVAEGKMDSLLDRWMNSEYAPLDDESGDDNALFNKAIHFASDVLNGRSDSESLAWKLVDKFNGADDVDEGRFGRSNYYNPMDYERDQQRQMDYDKREFKRQELQHELGHEDDPDFERNLRQQAMDRDRGPWYLKVNGKILKVKGEPKVFDWKKGANNYGLAILKNKPELQGKIMLTKKAEDDQVEATGDALGTISSVTPDGKVSIKTSTGDEIKTDQSALMPGAGGTVQMKPDAAGDTLKPGAKVVSTEGTAEEDMLSPQRPGDSNSPINGDEDHDEMSKLLVLRLKRLAGL